MCLPASQDRKLTVRSDLHTKLGRLHNLREACHSTFHLYSKWYLSITAVMPAQTLRGAGEASQSVGDAIFKHADSIQHLAETLEEEVSRYTDELAAQIALFHESAGRITSAGFVSTDRLTNIR